MALIDVGGTLWPNSWPFRETDRAGRMQRLAAALPELDAAAIRSLGEDLIASSRPGDEARSVSTENQVSITTPADELITASLTRQGLPAGAGTVRRIRRAMALPVHDRMKPLTEGMQGMIDYVSPLVDERIVNPGDDFISVLANGEKQGVFSRHEVLVNTSLLLLAGHETTINLICNGTLAFLQHPDQWALLKEDPAGRTRWATEECLRYDSPVKSIQRIATQDVEMRGKVLGKADRIRWFMSSANRDRWTMISEHALKNSITKSRSLTASRLLRETPLKSNAVASASRSIGNEVPASAAEPSGRMFTRRRVSASRSRSRASISK